MPTADYRPILFLTILTLALVGCSKPQRDPSQMQLILEHDVPTLDPALSTGTNSGKVVALLFSNLVIYDENGSVEPELASTWTISDDARTYVFQLRKDASFSRGRPVTSGDVSYSIHRVLTPATKSPRTWVFDRLKGAKQFVEGESKVIEGVSTPDPHELVLTLAEPFAPFLGFLAMPAAAIVDREAVEREGDSFGRKPMGSGPYMLEEWVMIRKITLKRNPHSHTKTKLDGVTFRVMNEPFTYSTEFKVGNLDMIPLPYSEEEFFGEHPVWKEQILSRPGLNTYFIGLNCKKGPCSKAELRKAICHAINTKLIVETTRKNQAVRAKGPIPPGLAGHDPEFQGIEYSTEKAREFLKKSGYEEGIELRLLQDDRNENLEVTQLVVSSLAQIGIKVKLCPMEWGVYTSRINEGEFDMYYRSWLADYTDAENFLFPLFHSSQAGSAGNRPRYSIEKVDEMIERAQGMIDENKRLALYRKIQRRVVNDCAYAFLFHKLERVVIQPWLKNFVLYPVFNSYKYDEVYLDEDILNDR